MSSLDLKNRCNIKNIPVDDIIDIDLKFYKSFNIKPIEDEVAYFTGTIGYKPITATIILQLISILNKYLAQGLGTCSLISGCSVFEVYEDVLEQCIKYRDELYDEVKDIFGE